ncbi:hypothetical protein BU14_0426s0010 [Porphyra umbilicalis]|uniref:Uncharacterized protein n=1 Tax=Porphyra umbilicalis TaxID=2786 RepID=A0A1X6NV86_PORUM|nr:hypothetical protein BU14_0426s0010 [Porphyra umbilicalis]|eukprot:OSX72544.1 hypothetical protein BU14_0426s0010 [Porphyra umbilicalis]
MFSYVQGLGRTNGGQPCGVAWSATRQRGTLSVSRGLPKAFQSTSEKSWLGWRAEPLFKRVG